MADGKNPNLGFFNSLERIVLRLVVFGITALVIIQTAMVNPSIRRVLNEMERLEGTPYKGFGSLPKPVSNDEIGHTKPGVSDYSTVSFELLGMKNLPETTILVNGQPVADFDYSVATVEVRPGDLIEVECDKPNMQAKFRVKSVSPGIISPREGAIYEAYGRTEIGRVGLSQLVKR